MKSDKNHLLDTTGSSTSNASISLSITSPHSLVTFQNLVDTAKGYARNAKSANTKKAYRSDWRMFEAWCLFSGVVALPAQPEVVALYISALAKLGKRVSTITRILVSISQAHKLAEYPSPTSSAQVHEIMKGIRRTLGISQRQKSAVETANLRAMVGELGDDLLSLRDRALLLIGFAGAFRRSELVGLNVRDVEFTADGLIITLEQSKTDQESKGHQIGIPHGSCPLACPVRALKAWLDAANITEGPVFRGVGRWNRVGSRRLNDRAVARIVKKYTALIGLNSSSYSGHSLRSGFATSAARAGKSERSIMNQTGHRSVTMVRRYIRQGSLFSDNAADGLL